MMTPMATASSSVAFTGSSSVRLKISCRIGTEMVCSNSPPGCQRPAGLAGAGVPGAQARTDYVAGSPAGRRCPATMLKVADDWTGGAGYSAPVVGTKPAQ